MGHQGPGVRNLMKRVSALAPTPGSVKSAAGCMGATLGPQKLLDSWPPSWHTTPPPPASSPADK